MVENKPDFYCLIVDEMIKKDKSREFSEKEISVERLKLTAHPTIDKNNRLLAQICELVIEKDQRFPLDEWCVARFRDLSPIEVVKEIIDWASKNRTSRQAQAWRDKLLTV